MDPKTMNLEGKVLGYEKKTLAVIAIAVIGAAVFFYAGAKYEKHKLSALGLLANSKSSSSASKKAAAANSLKGTVTAKDDKSVTIKLADDTEKTIQFGNGMTFGKSGTLTAAEISVGGIVVITGENNADGTFVATNIRASKKSLAAPATTAPNGTTTVPGATIAPDKTATPGTAAPVAPKSTTPAPTAY